MWGSNLNFSNWKGEMGKREPGGGWRGDHLWHLSWRSSGVINGGGEQR
jgi:hypothetical protein